MKKSENKINHIEPTKAVYDKYAGQFEERTKNYLRNYIWEDANLFVSNLSGKEILDLGSGPGRDSVFLKHNGLNPLCIDISLEMVRLCKEKGLLAMVGNLEELNFGKESFDGVWAYTSLLHMPKQKLPTVIKNINKTLKPEGIFYLGMKQGDYEDWQENPRYPGEKRFVSLYSDSELRKILEPHFEVFHASVVTLKGDTYLNYLTRKINKK